MWVVKITFPGDKTLIGSRCKKHGVSFSGYPISTRSVGNHLQVFAAFFLFGENKKVKDFVADLKQDKRVMNIENNENYVVCQLKEPSKNMIAYSPDIFHVEPIFSDAQGIETWTLGSWNKKSLMSFLDLVEKDHTAKLHSIQEKKIDNFSIISMHPSLTASQKEAMNLAISQGYYAYPRRIDVQALAKLSNSSYATFHAHLRKAEQRLLPFIFNRDIENTKSFSSTNQK